MPEAGAKTAREKLPLENLLYDGVLDLWPPWASMFSWGACGPVCSFLFCVDPFSSSVVSALLGACPVLEEGAGGADAGVVVPFACVEVLADDVVAD